MAPRGPTWDAPLVAALARELEGRLAGARLRALHLDTPGRSAALLFREGTLFVRLHPGASGVALGEPIDPPPFARPLPAVLEAVEAPADDRVLLLGLRRARGRRRAYRVAIELLPGRWNFVLAELEGAGGVARVRHALLSGRAAPAPGAEYAPPPPSRREGAHGALELERWMSLLLPLPPGERRGALLSSVAWTSKLNVEAILGKAAVEAGAEGEAALRAGHALWCRISAAALGSVDLAGEGGPVLLHLKGGLQPYPLPLPGTPHERAGSLLEAFRRSDAARGRSGEALVPGAWVEALENRTERLRRKAWSLQRELDGAEDPRKTRALADLLLARYADVPRGATAVTLPDFEGHPVEIELDPALAPHENAARYYERAQRAERALERLPVLVEEARREAGQSEALLARARAGEAEAEEVLAALPEEAEAAPDGRVARLPYRRYRSSGGLEIRVGRGARRNDDLTFHHSSPEDVWLHARHAAGAHVVLRWREPANPPARDLAEAAVLAALHSRGRTSASVPVDWTRRKYVRKPRKAPPGVVLPDRVRTLFVAPDPSLEERLREED